MRRLLPDLWTGFRTAPARAVLAFASLALGLFAATVLLAALDALRLQARTLVQSFGADVFVLTPAPERSWNRREVDFFRRNLGADAWVSGVKILAPVPGVDFAVVAADEALGAVRNLQLVAGRAPDGAAVARGERQALAPLDLCQRQRWRVGEVIAIGAEGFRLAGCYRGGDDTGPGLPAEAVIIPYTAGALDADSAPGRVDALLFRACPGVDPAAVQRRVAALLEQPGLGSAGVQWTTPETRLAGVRRWQKAIGWTAGTGGALGLLLGAVTLAGMLLAGVRERVPEVGLRRALGARRREVAVLFVAEALVLAGAAAATGMLAAEIALRQLGERFPLPFHFGAETRILPLALAGILALICSLGPAGMAARLPPAEALRNE